MSRIDDSIRDERPSISQLKSVNEPHSRMTGPTLYASLIGILANISTMKSVWRERRKLKFLSDDQLRDIGVSSQAAELESKRIFLDIPEERRRVVRSNTGSKIKEYFNVKS